MNKSESPTLRELREQNKRSREEVAEVFRGDRRIIKREASGCKGTCGSDISGVRERRNIETQSEKNGYGGGRMKEILKPKSKALTEKDCYEELARIIKIYCYQAVVREEIEFFRWWVKNVLTQLSEYASSPDEPGKYPAYKELLRKANEFIREPAEDPSRVMMQRAELKAALENAAKAGGVRVRPRKSRTQEKPEKQAK